MFYKPNFCCNCGEKIQRAEWKLLTSRRFCDVCGVENKGHELLPKVIVIAGVLLGVFGLGSNFGGSRQPESKASLMSVQPADARSEIRLPAAAPQRPLLDAGQIPVDRGETSVASLPNLPTGSLTKEQPGLRNPASDEPVYYCGALTKKGKPCSRRVKTKVRCWQHSGQESALEPRPSLDVY